MERLEVSQSWSDKDIQYDKSWGRNDGIYPNTVLWGVCINGCHNPDLMTFLKEVAKVVNQFVPEERYYTNKEEE